MRRDGDTIKFDDIEALSPVELPESMSMPANKAPGLLLAISTARKHYLEQIELMFWVEKQGLRQPESNFTRNRLYAGMLRRMGEQLIDLAADEILSAVVHNVPESVYSYTSGLNNQTTIELPKINVVAQ